MNAPPDSTCTNHPVTVAANICARCGAFICATCSVGTATGVFCPRCLTSSHVLADRGSRFLANLIDNVVVMGPMVLAAIVFAVLADSRRGGPSDTAVVLMMLGLFGGFAVGCAVQVVMQLRFGQSVGKRLLRIKVVRTDGSAVELWRIILLRNVALHLVAQVCGLVGIIDSLMIFSAEQRCLHDLFSDTIVVDANDSVESP